MTMIWHPIEIERTLSAGYRYREQLRRKAQEREARGELLPSNLPVYLPMGTDLRRLHCPSSFTNSDPQTGGEIPPP